MRNLRTLNPYFWRYKWLLISGFVFVALSASMAVFPAIYIRQAFDAVADAINGVGPEVNSTPNHLAVALLIYAGIILALSVGRSLFTFLMRQTLIVMSRHIEYDLKNDVYAQYQSLDMAFYRRNSTGDLMNRISEDINRVRMYLGPALMYSINMIFSITITLSFMFAVDARLSWLTLAPMPVLVFCIYKVASLIQQRSHDVQVQQSAISSLAQETFSGIRVLKAYVLGPTQLARYEASANESFRQNERLYRVNALFMPLMILLVGTSTVIAVWIGGQGVVEGRLSPGVIAEFVYYVGLLTWPVASMGWVVSLVQRAEASMQRVNDFLQLEPEVNSPDTPSTPATIQGRIAYQGVNFTYPDSGIEALKDIDLDVAPGQTVVIVGTTGSGKSTLGHMLTRQMDPTSGSVQVDGVAVQDWNLQALRRAVGVVPQDAFLFSMSIRDNIALGCEDATDDMVQAQAKLAHVHDDIMGLAKGYDTVVGERGLTLSGGQKQRVSIARALIKSPPVLLFDDALSAVDTDTEMEILTALKTRLKGVTAILITQRLSCVHLADQIVVMDEGRIVQRGQHQELMTQEGLYRELYQLQNPEDHSS